MSTREEWAQRMWPVLMAAAHQRQTIQYGQLVTTVGYPGVAGNIGQFLDPILEYCRRNDLPALTVLVVNKDTGRPSYDVVGGGSVDVERERVYAHNWYAMPPPRF